jgi:hypothetical protein
MVAVHFIVSGVCLVVVGLLASCVGVDHRSWVITQSALCFISYTVLVGLYRCSLQTFFFLNTKHVRHDLEKNIHLTYAVRVWLNFIQLT